jgi:hypothetical protein
VSAQNPQVRVWQDAVRIITYGEGDPDPTPQFSIYTPKFPNYPYPVRSRLSREAPRTETWRTLNIENEYLACRILPDFGGHLHSCLDKRDRREVFYANPVIKKDLVGLRGAPWASNPMARSGAVFLSGEDLTRLQVKRTKTDRAGQAAKTLA